MKIASAVSASECKEVESFFAGVWDDSRLKSLDKIDEKCETCVMFRKTPSRPIVGLPLAQRFNEAVAMDLAIFKPGVYFLHRIDPFSRFSLSAVVTSKIPEVIIEKIMIVWVSSRMGCPKKFLAD